MKMNVDLKNGSSHEIGVDMFNHSNDDDDDVDDDDDDNFDEN